jgi:integrase
MPPGNEIWQGTAHSLPQPRPDIFVTLLSGRPGTVSRQHIPCHIQGSTTWPGGLFPSPPSPSRWARLWRHDDVGVREKALWRLLHETAARASEALSINVEDLELDNKRVRVRSKGGDLDWLHFQTGSARLLQRLIAGRTRGPLFLCPTAPRSLPARPHLSTVARRLAAAG